jgi:hypothetical protein
MKGRRYYGSGSGWWFSILRLYKRIDIAWWMAIMFMFLRVCLMVGMGSLKVAWSEFMEGMWVVARAPVVMTIIGATVQPRARILFRNESYLVVLEETLSGENLSLQYVNSIYWMITSGEGCWDGS